MERFGSVGAKLHLSCNATAQSSHNFPSVGRLRNRIHLAVARCLVIGHSYRERPAHGHAMGEPGTSARVEIWATKIFIFQSELRSY